MSTQPIDYAALAKQAGAVSSTPAPSGIDYAALAKQAGAISSTAPQQASNQAGAVSRFLTSGRQSLGIPSNPIEDLTGGIKFAAQNPGEAAKQIAMSPVESYKSAVTQQYQRAHDAYQRGDYGQALLHGLYYLLAPVGGANLGQASEQAKAGDIAGSLGTAAGTALPFLAANPEVRTNAAVPINAARTATANALQNIDPHLAKAAGVAAGYKIGGWPGGVVGGIAGPAAIAKTADLIRPEYPGIQPLPMSHAVIQNAIQFLNSPGMEGEAGASAFPPAAARGVIQRSGPPMTAAELADRMETRAMQQAMQQDLEKHGQSALSQERRTFFANNQPGTPKGELVEQAKNQIYMNAAKNSLPANASDAQIVQTASQLRYQDAHLAEILQKSIQQVQAKKTGQ